MFNIKITDYNKKYKQWIESPVKFNKTYWQLHAWISMQNTWTQTQPCILICTNVSDERLAANLQKKIKKDFDNLNIRFIKLCLNLDAALFYI